jgi:ribose transport system permease protein
MYRRFQATLAHFLSHYGMIVVLALLCFFFSVATYRQEAPTGKSGAASVVRQLAALSKSTSVVLVTQADTVDREFAVALQEEIKTAGLPQATSIEGTPPEVRAQLEAMAKDNQTIDVVATTPACGDWGVWKSLRAANPAFGNIKVIIPTTQGYSLFLTSANLRNVADQIGVIALIAIGMTLVILTGGIDLSVGSLVALSAVTTAWIVQSAGGANASPLVLWGAALTAILLCGLVGSFSGMIVSRFKIPAFIATLAMMQVASGMAFIIAKGQTLYALPPSFAWLGRGTTLGLSHAVWLMVLCYIGAHIFLQRTVPGRNIYAVGGNPEASRLSGIFVPGTLMLTYIVSGIMAGIGGVISTSQLGAGAPTYGMMYELYVIAAVVVGGTSLSGGSGKIFGTLIGAFIIAVIQNGMNLMNVEAYTQKVVLGLVILGSVLLDTARQKRAKKHQNSA